MKHSRWLAWSFVVSLVLALPAVGTAKEEADKFLDQLYRHGYGEVTLDYLDYLKQFNLLPEDVAENWDLYQARGWRMAIVESFNEKEIEERTTKAKAFLDKFIKSHPESGEVGEEVSEWGEMSYKAGLRLLGQAGIAKDTEKKDAFTLKARASFEEALPRFEQTIELYRKSFTALQAAGAGTQGKGKAKNVPNAKQQAIDDAELKLADAQLKLAKVEFFLGMTYADDKTEPGKAARKTVLEKSRKEFSDIYQRYRTGVIGLMAHTYEGKTSEELGDPVLAKEMYDEVLALMPPNGKEKTDKNQEEMFSRVQYFYFMIVLKQPNGDKDFLPEARQWLKLFVEWQAADGYQGIALEVARADMALLEKGGGDQKVQIRKELDAIFKQMKKIPSEYHREGMELAKELNKKGSGGGTPKTYEEAIANGDDFFGARKWDEAIKSYEAAIPMTKGKGLPKDKRKAVLDGINEKLETCRYNQVYELFAGGKEDEALAQIASLFEDKKIDANGETAGKLAALRVHIVLRRYATSRDAGAKEKLLVELTEAADEMIKKWPNKPAADDARMAMAQAAMVQGKIEDGITQFENVSQRSERYPLALHYAAMGHLRVWNAEKQKEAAERKPKVMKEESGKAVEDLEKSIELQTKAITAGEALPPQLIESELVLGQVYLETGEANKTAELLQPVVDSIKAAKPEKLDQTMIKVFSAAVKAYVATGDMSKGGEVATLLTDLGEDVPEVNGVLVNFARMLYGEYKQASATLIEAKAENDLVAREAAETRLTGTKELLGKLLERLAPRKHNTPISMMSIGDIAYEIGLPEQASEIDNRILTEAAANPEFHAQCGKNGVGLIRVRSQLVDLLRQKGQYEEGLKQVDALIQEVPNALEPMMTKGRILQAWAEKDAAKFPEAESHWAKLRQKLFTIINKPRAPADLKASYYEANYNVALCLLLEAEKTKNPDKAIDAQKVLNASLISSPKLDGPENVAKYHELIKKSAEFAKKGQKAPTPPTTAAKSK